MKVTRLTISTTDERDIHLSTSSVGVTLATIWMALSSPSLICAHWRIEMIDLIAANPSFAIRTVRIALFAEAIMGGSRVAAKRVASAPATFAGLRTVSSFVLGEIAWRA